MLKFGKLLKPMLNIMCNSYYYHYPYLHVNSDAAKSDKASEDITVYTALGSSATLTMNFYINPVNNYPVHWYMGDSVIQDTTVRNTVIGTHVQTTYTIFKVTHWELGNYKVQVTNWAIHGEHREVTFNLKLALRGENYGSIYC